LRVKVRSVGFVLAAAFFDPSLAQPAKAKIDIEKTATAKTCGFIISRSILLTLSAPYGETVGAKLGAALTLAVGLGFDDAANGVVNVVGVGEPVAKDPPNGSLFGSGFIVASGPGLTAGCCALAGLISTVGAG
jgi:hypothetical protein